MNKYSIMAFLGIMLLGNVLFAETTLSSSLSNIQNQITTLVPIISLVMIVLAGLVYAAGQVMGAEMRSRASVWATSLLVGAIIGLVLAASAGGIVGMFSGAALISGP